MSSQKKSSRLEGKDLITIGIYTVIYVVIVMLVAMLGFIPIFIPLMAVLCPLIGAAGPEPLEKAGQNNSDRRTPPLLPSRSCRSCAVCKRWGD